ncbi:MAG: AAA family ATPase [Gammaproteobacteria bacterium]|nr:AAA family ATPase [Gammaproteobacteria bacterium]
MNKCIAVANQKGGVGKTTTSVNLAASLADKDARVLVVDLDPQGNATMGSGIDKRELGLSSFDVLMGESPLLPAVLHLAECRYALLPGNSDLTGAEVALVEDVGGELCMRQALEDAAELFDYVIIDCPPSLNMLTVNALAAANSVIIPMQCEYYALEGLSALLDTINRIRTVLNPGLRVEGLLRTMFDVRNNLSTQVSAQLVKHFGDKVYRTIIPRNVRLAEAPSHGLPALLYDRSSSGAMAYLALASELVNRSGVTAAGLATGRQLAH